MKWFALSAIGVFVWMFVSGFALGVSDMRSGEYHKGGYALMSKRCINQETYIGSVNCMGYLAANKSLWSMLDPRK